MDVTDLQPYSMKKISHNSVNVHRIPTKVHTEMHLNEPFTYTKFQLDQSTCLHFMADFVKYVKRRKKQRKKP